MSDYSATFPTQRPVFTADFSNGSKIDPRATFTRASTANVFDGSKHKSSENLIAYSNPVTSQWTETNTAITVNALAAPDGTTTASNVLETAATGYHEVRENFACTNAVSHTATFYAKANGRTVVRFLPRTSSGVIANVEFTLSGAGSESLISGTATRSIAAVGSGGWYKLTITFTGNATATGEFQVNLCESAGTDSYAGDATKGVYLWGAQVSSIGGTVLNATSGQIHREYAPTLASKANNAARFETATDGQSAGTSLGILVEGQSNNLALNSEDFSNASWNKIRTSVIANSAISPSGDLTADLLMDDGSTATSHFVQPLSAIATGMSVGSSTVSFSVYAKSAGRDIRIVDGYQTSNGATAFNLTNGTVISGSGSIESCGNGWYRCSTVVTIDSSTSVLPVVQLYSGSTSYDGDSYSGALLWGFQVENGSGSGTSFASSYIATTSSTATRAADSLSAATADIGLTAGQDVTLYAEGDFGDPAIRNSNRFAVALQANSNSYIILYNGGSNSGSGYVRDGGTDQAYFPSGITAGAFKAAISAKNSSFKYAANGTSATEDTSGTVPEYNTLRVGGHSSSGSELDGHVKRVAIYGQSLSSSELAAITS